MTSSWFFLSTLLTTCSSCIVVWLGHKMEELRIRVTLAVPAGGLPAGSANGAPDNILSRLRLKCNGTREETRFRLSAKRTSPFKSAGASVQSTTGSRGVRISGNNAGYTTFRGSVKSTGYPLHSPVSLSLPLPCVTVCHHISTGLYHC